MEKTKFRFMLWQVPLGGEFVLNECTFKRGVYLPNKEAFRCQEINGKFDVILNKRFLVEPITIENEC